MPEADAGSDWSKLASWYDELLAAGSGPHETAVASLLRLVPDLTGAAVLDVACGQGLATRALAEAGAASVVGVDAAPAMIDIARRRTPEHLPISWRVDNAEALQTFSPAAFHGATCQLGLMDIADLTAALRSIRRVLRPQAWFVFVISHPCFLAPHTTTCRGDEGRLGRLITHYVDEEFWRSSNPHRGRAGNHHRPGYELPARRRRRAAGYSAPPRAATRIRQRPHLLRRPRIRRVTSRNLSIDSEAAQTQVHNAQRESPHEANPTLALTHTPIG